MNCQLLGWDFKFKSFKFKIFNLLKIQNLILDFLTLKLDFEILILKNQAVKFPTVILVFHLGVSLNLILEFPTLILAKANFKKKNSS